MCDHCRLTNLIAYVDTVDAIFDKINLRRKYLFWLTQISLLKDNFLYMFGADVIYTIMMRRSLAVEASLQEAEMSEKGSGEKIKKNVSFILSWFNLCLL